MFATRGTGFSTVAHSPPDRGDQGRHSGAHGGGVAHHWRFFDAEPLSFAAKTVISEPAAELSLSEADWRRIITGFGKQKARQPTVFSGKPSGT